MTKSDPTGSTATMDVLIDRISTWFSERMTIHEHVGYRDLCVLRERATDAVLLGGRDILRLDAHGVVAEDQHLGIPETERIERVAYRVHRRRTLADGELPLRAALEVDAEIETT